MGFFFFLKTKLGEDGGWIQEEKLGQAAGGVWGEFDQNIFYTCVTFSVNKNIVLRGGTEKVFVQFK